MKSKSVKALVVLIAAVLLGGFSLQGEVELRDNQYGLSEIRVMDLRFSFSNTYDDGPYVFIEPNQIIEKSIVAGEVITKTVALTERMTHFAPEKSVFYGVEKMAALSDIHGQHDLFITLLKNNKIIDDQLKWAFGKGHMVITGDIFDRGSKVLDTLWFLMDLESQASTEGGKVHYLLGNHEYMVLRGETWHLHGNYKQTADLLDLEYAQLFNPDTVLGRWLRSKSTVIKINDTLFMHGGLSEAFVSHELNLDTINQRFRQSIDMTEDEIDANPIYSMLHNSNGPIWYRGLVKHGGLPDADVDRILNKLEAKRIAVGHTSVQQVMKINDGRVFAIDSSMKKGLNGELLLLTGDAAFRGTFDGRLLRF